MSAVYGLGLRVRACAYVHFSVTDLLQFPSVLVCVCVCVFVNLFSLKRYSANLEIEPDRLVVWWVPCQKGAQNQQLLWNTLSVLQGSQPQTMEICRVSLFSK